MAGVLNHITSCHLYVGRLGRKRSEYLGLFLAGLSCFSLAVIPDSGAGEFF